jgi:cation transport ATPase
LRARASAALPGPGRRPAPWPGVGVESTVDGQRLFVGRPGTRGGLAGGAVRRNLAELEAQGRPAVAAAGQGRLVDCWRWPTSCVPASPK